MTRNGASAAHTQSPIEKTQTPARPSATRLASEETAPVASGVHDLQARLARSLEDARAAKWSPGATLGFIILVCGGFWVGVALAVHILLR